MITNQQHTIFALQYGRVGEPAPVGDVSPFQAEKFVGLDTHRGIGPLPVPLQSAHNFRSESAAEKYAAHFKGLHVRKISVVYSYTQDTEMKQT